MNPEELLLANLGLIDRIVIHVCRRNHWSGDDAQEFDGYVRLKLIENDYFVLRRFEGRSAFSTYATTVIQRLAFQYRVETWGRWRPSAEAQRIGQAAITLERLLTRDGYSFAEAVETLTTGLQPAYTRAELEAIHVRLPLRLPRPVLVQELDAANTPAHTTADAGAMQRERELLWRAAVAALDRAMGELEERDQLILRMRFWAARRMPEIAEAVGIDAKKLYKRIERLMRDLRHALQSDGVAQSDIADLLDHTDIDFGAKSPIGRRNPGIRRSKSDGDVVTTDTGTDDRSHFSG